MLTRSSPEPLAEQLSARFAERIRTRLIAPGARLPSVRECARQQGVSPATVVAAYDRLQAAGLVEARRQRGFFARDFQPAGTRSLSDPPAATSKAAARPAPIDATTLIRGMFHGASDKPQPGSGVLPAAWLDAPFLGQALRRVTAARAVAHTLLQYGEPAGDAGLRAALSRRLADLQIPAQPTQIVTTLGATQALDIASRALLRAGDPVMVDEPGWAVEFARLSALGYTILPVPRGPDGPDLAVMQRYCEVHRPRLYVTVSVLHNPTGYCLGPASAHRVLQLAVAHDFHILEDDSYSHFVPGHATRLSALDGLERTVYVGGFAKLLAPNWRVGFLAAAPSLAERMLDAKLLATLTTPALGEKALAWCLEQGLLRRHAERIRERLGQARQRSARHVKAAGLRFAAEPAGLFGWVDLGQDTEALAQRMLDEGYLIAPGALFHAERRPSTLMRINFAAAQDAGFWEVLARVRKG